MTTESQHTQWLLAAGIGSALVAVLHVAIIFIGPSAYRYFGAGSMAPLAEQGSYLPAIITGVFAGVFALWSVYAFSGAQAIPRLPFLRPVLFIIGGIYTLRGVAVAMDLYFLLGRRHPAPHMTAFSASSLIIGLCYLFGARKAPVASTSLK